MKHAKAPQPDAPAHLPASRRAGQDVRRRDMERLQALLIPTALIGLLLLLGTTFAMFLSATNPLDQGIWQTSLTWRTGFLDAPIIALTQGFNTLPMTVYVLVAVVIFSVIYRSAWPLLSIGGTMILTPLLVTLIKNLIGRPRPLEAHWLVEETTFSFPSGHSASTVAFCLALFLTAYPLLTTTGRWLAGIPLTLLALTIGFTRLYVGVHWATDVIGGLGLGLAVAASVHLLVYRRVNPHL